MEKLFTLLALQRQGQEAATLETFAHIITNETLKLVSYKQAIFWQADGRNISLHTVSGNAAIDPKSPYALQVKSFIERHAFKTGDAIQGASPVLLYSRRDLADDKKIEINSAAALMIFSTAEDGIVGGLWLERETDFEKPEQQLLKELGLSYAYALITLQLRRGNPFRRLGGINHNLPLYGLAAMLACLFIPVRLSIIAPAEIVALNPVIISVPFDGMLTAITVQPGDAVKPEQAIAEMDKIILKARLDTVNQELSVAKTGLSRLHRESLSSPEKKIELKKLEAEIAAQTIERDYASQMMERSIIRSPVEGLAIFADKHSLQGKPARMGEKIMMVADPAQSELLIRVPADAMVPIHQQQPVKFFLNTAPLKSHRAQIRSIGYQASPDPDGLLSYKIHATLDETGSNNRIGWKGTAKLYGDRTILGYALLRRPLANLRAITGI